MALKLNLGVSSALAVLALAPAVRSEPSVPLDRFDPAPPGDALLSVPDARVQGNVGVSAGFRLVYAHAPLVLSLSRSDGSSERITVVDHQLLAHVLVATSLGQRLLLDLDAPAVLSQSGDSGTLGAQRIGAPSGADFANLRLGARLALLEQHGHVPGAAFAGSVWAPTGSGAYAGSDKARWAASGIVGSDYPSWLWRAQLGVHERRADTVYSGVFGSEAFAALGAGYRIGPAQLGAELLGATSMDAEAGWLGSNTTHLEALFSARYGVGPFSFFAGGGPGLTRGAGTPEYRVLFGADARFELQPGTKSRATAPAPSSSSAPPSTPPVSEPDRDRDGVPDARDLCPDVIGDPLGPRPGCPPDADGDGIADADDRCPSVPGVPSADPARHGCPADRDGDGIADTLDACPDEHGPASSDPRQNGCPTAVRVVGSQIVISEQVNFATASDVLAPESSKVLEQVAGVIKEHAEIARVAVDGHTDNVGQDKTNLALSRRRALAVVRWLVEHGVDERRLEARGFGARRPVADVKTPEGRAMNRRVEFQILKKSELGARAWKDGPVDE